MPEEYVLICEINVKGAFLTFFYKHLMFIFKIMLNFMTAVYVDIILAWAPIMECSLFSFTLDKMCKIVNLLKIIELLFCFFFLRYPV